ncbi:F-box domain containing protein [Metarhizium rileyi]|uniref:F-box domain containing protein n=1 Tax=Metarhizium rileyi (strain RCEF 4871) TaxID=1649241 RepID=A0A167C029_METRR|nr:F-box domain containing protein [Metarhizium rileyi RCEF 4871]
MSEPDRLDSELESFRQQWLSEVRSKTGEQSRSESTAFSLPQTPTAHQPPRPKTRKPPPPTIEEEDEHVRTLSFDDGPEPGSAAERPGSRALVSALDHYEEAMEREAQGNMGESLKLYRKAYRLDHGVDRRYREKHFPPKHPGHPEPPATPDTALPTRTPDLIASFAGLWIEPEPESQDTPSRPCPMSSLPAELLVHISRDLAALDVGDFARLSLVCKPLAYIAALDQTWRQVCLSTRHGFTGMHYDWNKTVEWDPLEHLLAPDLAQRRRASNIAVTMSLVPDPYATWMAMFRSRPRIRFNGCYISTVNYVRTGQASTNQATWGGAPIHIVTYYRYLRFFRDGTLISLLTTLEPALVVHHLDRHLLHLHRDSAHAYLPSVVMQRAYKGRWRLSLGEEGHVHPGPGGDHDQLQDGDVTIETEGVDPKYMFRMDLSLRTAGKAARNNKIVWRGFFSYNKLTDDWAEFTLKHDKAFFFSRVRSYGLGE